MQGKGPLQAGSRGVERAQTLLRKARNLGFFLLLLVAQAQLAHHICLAAQAQLTTVNMPNLLPLVHRSCRLYISASAALSSAAT